MNDFSIDQAANLVLNQVHRELEARLGGDVLYLNGPMAGNLPEACRDVIENLRAFSEDQSKQGTDATGEKTRWTDRSLYVILTTIGGSAEVVERLVNVIRHHYDKVSFIVPDYAYSAGTILCMSGDAIYMDYYSVLGPIDPQVETKDGKLIPALGYLDKVKELIQKSKDGELTDAEFMILKDFDLGELRFYEQQRDLTIDLLEKWLVKYKFAHWTTHSTSKKDVTPEEKAERAKDIAGALSDPHKWKSHGRPLSIIELQNIGLKIDDYSRDERNFHGLVRQYDNLAREYMNITGTDTMLRMREEALFEEEEQNGN